MLSPTSWSREEAFRWWLASDRCTGHAHRNRFIASHRPTLAIPWCVHLHTRVCIRTHPLHRSLEGCTQRCVTPRCKWVTLRDTPLKKPVSPWGRSPRRHLSNRARHSGACLDGLRWKWGLRLGPASRQRAGLEAFSGDIPARARQAVVKKKGGGRRTRRGRARAARGEAVGSAGVTAVTRKRHLA